MKRTEPKQLGEIIDDALKASNLDTVAAEHRASYLWAEVVGPGLNRYTARRYVERGVMHVYLTSGPLKNELSFHRARIIEALNRAVGSDVIKDIIFY